MPFFQCLCDCCVIVVSNLNLTTPLCKYQQVTFADWGAKKASTRWGQMPMLQIEGGAEMAQTKAIAKFLGKQARP